MSIEFNSKIQNLSSKLNNLQQSNKRETAIEDTKDQLKRLQDFIKKELISAEKRVRKIENRLDKRKSSSRREEIAINNIWSDKEEKVSELIGGWVEEYEEKTEQALCLLERQDKIYQMKLEEEQEVISKEARMEENKVKELLRTLEKEVGKLNTINSQNYSSINKQIISAKQVLQDSIQHTQHLIEQKGQEVEWRMSRIKDNLKVRYGDVRDDMNARLNKLKHVLKLLLDIE